MPRRKKSLPIPHACAFASIVRGSLCWQAAAAALRCAGKESSPGQCWSSGEAARVEEEQPAAAQFQKSPSPGASTGILMGQAGCEEGNKSRGQWRKGRVLITLCHSHQLTDVLIEVHIAQLPNAQEGGRSELWRGGRMRSV